MNSITILGKRRASGAYVLRIRVDEPLALSFGRFQGGRTLSLAEGEYVYAGSAMGTTGGATLARRVLRHASRSGGRQPHDIYPALLSCLLESGLLKHDVAPAADKRLHWHVDYLLDHPNAALIGLVLICSPNYQEAALARMIDSDPDTIAFAAGLGASDRRGAAHLQAIALPAPQELACWWRSFVDRVQTELATSRAELRREG